MRITLNWKELDDPDGTFAMCGRPILTKVDDHTADVNVEALVDALYLLFKDYMTRMLTR